MPRAKIKTKDFGSDAENFKRCTNCNAPFKRLAIGGVGSWQTKIQCLECFYVRDGVPRKTIDRLVADRYDLPLDEAQRANTLAQEDYERVLAGGRSIHTPPHPGMARHVWLRRNIAGLEV